MSRIIDSIFGYHEEPEGPYKEDAKRPSDIGDVRLCLSCGNRFDPAEVDSRCSRLYNLTICRDCCNERARLISGNSGLF